MPAEQPLDSASGRENLSTVKHDIKNHLSNMYLAIEQLRHELKDANADPFADFCVDTLSKSCAAINELLEKIK